MTSEYNLSTTYLQLLSMGGQLACDIFIIISGYYGIKKDAVKKIPSYIMTMYYYNALIFVASGLLKDIKINYKELIFPFIWGNWFLIWYLVLLAIGPYITGAMENIRKEDLKAISFIVFVFWSAIPTFIPKSYMFSNFDTFFIMYFYGNVLRIYAEEIYAKLSIVRKITFCALILFYGSVPLIDAVGVLLHNDFILNNADYFRPCNSVLTICCSMGIFVLFCNKTFFNDWINKTASLLLGIYLIHDNSMLRDIIWNVISPNVAYKESMLLLIVHSTVKISIVFIVCALIEISRKKLWELVRLLRMTNEII